MVSLDAFRGMTIAGMTLVNNPGTWSAIYAPLKHAEWHGCTPTDLVFPFFLFISGVSMAFSFARRGGTSSERAGLFRHVLRRSAIIFFIGLLLNAIPYFNLGTLRIMGVLQRIGLCYLAAGTMAVYLGRKGRAVATASLLLGYWALMALVPAPGGVRGDLSPAGNLGAWIDRAVLGTDHLWSGARHQWDPEGLLSTLPAVATVLLGLMLGDLLRSERSTSEKVRAMLLWGAVGVAAGWIWGFAFPINKSLWTSSYTVYTAGLAALGLAAFYWLIDVKRRRAWAKPFIVFGMNAILVFVASTFMSKMLGIFKTAGPDGRTTSWWGAVYAYVFQPLASPVNASLMMAIAYVLLWLAIMWWFYARRIFVKI